MLLSKVVGAILTDFVTAQDLSNEYASQISRKYKQYKDSKENILNNFDVPASVLKEIDLELKFAVTDLNDESYGLDVEETWGNCQDIADKAVTSVIRPLQDVIHNVISAVLPTLLTSQQQPTPEVQSRETNLRREIEGIWTKVSNNLNNDKFKEYLKKKITQKLFKTCKGQFLRGREGIDIEIVKEIVRDKLQEGILKHPDIQEAIKSTQEIATMIDTTANVRGYVQQMTTAISRIPENTDNINERNVRKLIQKLPGVVPHADIMITPSFLRELPIEIISSLKITVQMDSYKWALTETGESLNKAKR